MLRPRPQKFNNDVNAAINAYFEDPVGSLKEPPPANQWQEQDNIPYADDSSMGGMPAMSRPPSRTDHGRSFVDLSYDHAEAFASDAKTLREQEEMNDPAIQRAMAESLQQNLPAQENGVTSTGAHFGPAKREYYEPSSWALTTFSTAREIIDHPPPSKRRRIDDEPAFLRGPKETDYLAPMLTIYHSIPLAREAMLMPSLKIHAYGHENSWWSGTTDENVKALSTDSTLRIDRDECNVLAEVQCLMAFLDRTNRAYGSVDALADLQKVRRSKDSSSFLRVMQAWSTAALRQDPSEQLTQVFTSTAVKDDGSGNNRQEENMVCVEPFINPALGQTLVDILDTTVWDDERGNIDDVWIDHAAEIFTIRIRDPNPGKAGLNLSLDPVWYPDRYMHECREATMQIRKQLQHLRRDIEQCTAIQRRCDIAKVPDNRVLMTREVLDAAAKASAGVIGKTSISHGLYDGQGAISEDAVSAADVEEVRQELQSILRRIEQKSQQLEQRKAGLRLTMRKIASQLTQPTPESPNLPRRKYTLQGVSTKTNITYVRRPSQDLLHLDDEESSSEDPESQWWKMAWLQDEDANAAPVAGPITREQAEAGQNNPLGPSAAAGDGSRPYTVLKITEKEVLEAVRSEHQSVLLVYANENAMRFKGSELSLPLRRFVERDNQAFSEELREEEGTPIDQSVDVEAETEFEDVPLIDQTGSSSSVREFTPKSTSSPGVRDEDGQPSPKRAKEGNGSHSELPPSYEDSVGKPEMQERKVNKIGLYAEQMLQKYGGDVAWGAEGKVDRGEDLMHIEHSG
ncbi:hypothetical protein, variant 2 [Exophiala xenobiotica]|uniref:Uncharacterized protein n=1 Tax=Exophiala xenobiotica TaxID=348802 RepID=A0A0D2BY42_9EURO|nr:hypothetical protein, variant 2 [Exophiala xenobiotica]KIW57351.1 hypothetical protein, variant 2 [Exophiala xenobiotica]